MAIVQMSFKTALDFVCPEDILHLSSEMLHFLIIVLHLIYPYVLQRRDTFRILGNGINFELIFEACLMWEMSMKRRNL